MLGDLLNHLRVVPVGVGKSRECPDRLDIGVRRLVRRSRSQHRSTTVQRVLDTLHDGLDELHGERDRIEGERVERQDRQRLRDARVGHPVVAQVHQQLRHRIHQGDKGVDDRADPELLAEVDERLVERQRALLRDEHERRILIDPAVGWVVDGILQRAAVGPVGVAVRQHLGGSVVVGHQVVAVHVLERRDGVEHGERVAPVARGVADGVVLERVVGALDPDVGRQLRTERDVEERDRREEAQPREQSARVVDVADRDNGYACLLLVGEIREVVHLAGDDGATLRVAEHDDVLGVARLLERFQGGVQVLDTGVHRDVPGVAGQVRAPAAEDHQRKEGRGVVDALDVAPVGGRAGHASWVDVPIGGVVAVRLVRQDVVRPGTGDDQGRRAERERGRERGGDGESERPDQGHDCEDERLC